MYNEELNPKKETILKNYIPICSTYIQRFNEQNILRGNVNKRENECHIE